MLNKVIGSVFTLAEAPFRAAITTLVFFFLLHFILVIVFFVCFFLVLKMSHPSQSSETDHTFTNSSPVNRATFDHGRDGDSEPPRRLLQ